MNNVPRELGGPQGTDLRLHGLPLTRCWQLVSTVTPQRFF
jgi:hypothetical protein